MTYESYAKIAKALSEPKRVKILDMLSCGEMCACDILEHFDFTQPTLSHHIKVLTEAGMVTSEKRGPGIIIPLTKKQQSSTFRKRFTC